MCSYCKGDCIKKNCASECVVHYGLVSVQAVVEPVRMNVLALLRIAQSLPDYFQCSDCFSQCDMLASSWLSVLGLYRNKASVVLREHVLCRHRHS